MENNTVAKTPSSSSSKLRSKILKILPKAAAAVTMTFQNPPFSPGRDHHHHKPRSDHNNASSSAATTTTRLKPHGNKGFSGPIMIPDEARRKHKDGSGIETQEPTSPKVSCIGQIKHKKKKQIKKQNAKSMSLPIVATSSSSSTPKEDTTKTEEKKMKKQGSKKFQRMLIFNTGKPKTGVRKSSASSSVIGGEGNINDGASDNNAPPIGYMRRFASGRETFANFDWKAQIAPEEMNHRDFYSEDDRAESDDAGEEEEEEEIMIPFSAPIGGRGGGGGGNGNGGFGGGFGGGGVNLANLQPRKEINLWKRRTMAQPMPLQLNPVLTASK